MISFRKPIAKGLSIAFVLTMFLTSTVQAKNVQVPAKGGKNNSNISEHSNKKSNLTQDKKAAAAVDKMIQALPPLRRIKPSSAAAINAANTAYNALTDTQKALVKPANKKFLAAAVKTVTDLQAVSKVDALITALPRVNKITLADADAVNAANTAYQALSKDQKKLLSPSNKGKIIACVNKIASLKATAGSAALKAINSGTEVFSDFATAGVTGAVEANKTSYDTEIAKERTTKGSDLTLAEIQTIVNTVNGAAADLQAATTVINQISALDSTSPTYTTDLAAAQQAYDALTDVQKALVTNYADLTAAEQAAVAGQTTATATATN